MGTAHVSRVPIWPAMLVGNPVKLIVLEADWMASRPGRPQRTTACHREKTPPRSRAALKGSSQIDEPERCRILIPRGNSLLILCSDGGHQSSLYAGLQQLHSTFKSVGLRVLAASNARGRARRPAPIKGDASLAQLVYKAGGFNCHRAPSSIRGQPEFSK